ncbi:MAG: radical SAM protein [Acidobacteriota bacterium]
MTNMVQISAQASTEPSVRPAPGPYARPLRLMLIRVDAPEVIMPALEAPLGLLYLSAAVKRELGSRVDVTIRDMRCRGQNEKSLERDLQEWKPDVVGFSAISVEAARTAYWVDFVARNRPEALRIVGGPYATSSGVDVLTETRAHVVFRGEGELTLSELLQCLIEGRPYDKVPGIAARREDGETYLNGASTIVPDMNSLPMPDWAAIKISDYHVGSSMNLVNADPRYAPIMTSRGCPYDCIYCHQSMGQKMRYRDLDLVMEEIRLLHDTYGIRELQIIDDIFNVNRKRVLEFCRRIEESGMKLRLCFPNALRGDLLNEEVLHALKRAGTYMITVAVESGSPRIQEMIKKDLDLDKVAKNIRYADSIGIITKGYFMMGFVTETREEIERTIDLAVELPLLQVGFFTVVPQKDTGLFDVTVEHAPDFRYGDAPHYFQAAPTYTKAQGYDLPKLQRKAYMRFYLASPRLLRMLWRFPRRGHFLYRFVLQGARMMAAAA